MKIINFNYFTIAASLLLTIVFVIPEGYGRSTIVQRNEWLYRSIQSSSQSKKTPNAKVPASSPGTGLRSAISSSVSNSTKFVMFRIGTSSDDTPQRCRCVLFYQCNSENVVDTTSPQFLNESNVICTIGSEVCCREPVDNVFTETPSTGSLSVSVSQSLPITYDFTTPNSVVITGGGDDTPCICIPEEQCFISDPERQISGAGLINVRFTECRPNEVCCLQEDVVSPSPLPTPSQSPPQTYTPQPPIVVTDPIIPPIDPSDSLFTCGIRNLYSEKEIDTRIISPPGVSDTVFGEFPWMAILLKTDINENGQRQENVFQCGASIISHSIILTAAHCVPRIDMSLMKIRIGEYNTLLGSKKEPLPHQESNITTVLIHPNFNPSTLFNDVAIIVTEKRFNLTRNANPICLPANGDEKSYNPNRCIATGWGKHTFEEGGRFQTTLKKVELGLVANNECQRVLKKTRLGHYFKLHPSFICAGGQPGADTCQGDGGGPLVCELNNEPNKYVQVGIVSWGIGCGDEIPGVYASVIANLKWINEQINALTFNGIFRMKQS